MKKHETRIRLGVLLPDETVVRQGQQGKINVYDSPRRGQKKNSNKGRRNAKTIAY